MRENFKALVEAYKDDQDLLEMITRHMNTFSNYVNAVYMMEVQMTILHTRYEGQEYRDKVMDLDKNRRIAHEAAMSAISQLVRWAKMAGVEPIFNGDTTDRYQVADFCQAVVVAFFKDGQPGHLTMDDITHL